VTTPMMHLQFKNALCEALLVGWVLRMETRNESLAHRPRIHMQPRRGCVLCVKFARPAHIITSVDSNSCVGRRGATNDITKPF
jgi:hypothetical protein